MDVTMKDLAGAVGEAVKLAMAEHAKTVTSNGEKLFAPNLNKGAQPSEDKRSGVVKMAAMVRFLAAAKGDPERASKIADKAGDGFTAKRLVTTDFSAGGSLVPQEMSTEFFDALRPRSVVRSLNPLILPMENGTLTIPGITNGASASYRGEAVAANATSVQTGSIILTEKLLIALIPISNQLLRINSVGAENMISRDLISAMARAEDQNFLNGPGTGGRPLGIRRQLDDTHSTTGTSTSVTLQKIDSDLAAIRKQVKAADVDVTDGVYIMNTDIEEDLMKLRSGDIKAYPEMETGQRIGRYRYGSTNNMDAGVVLFGNASDIIIGESENLRVTMSEDAAYLDANGVMRAAFSEDVTVMRVTAGHDIALRYRKAFAEKTAVNYATLS